VFGWVGALDNSVFHLGAGPNFGIVGGDERRCHQSVLLCSLSFCIRYLSHLWDIFSILGRVFPYLWDVVSFSWAVFSLRGMSCIPGCGQGMVAFLGIGCGEVAVYLWVVRVKKIDIEHVCQRGTDH